ncbi:hypothetical protein PG988_016302 [Apiospora saccharicola]
MSNNLFDYGASLTSNDRHDHPFEASDFQGMLTGEWSPGDSSTGAYLSDEPSPSGYSPGMASTGAYLGFASSGPMGHPGVSSGGPCLSGWSPGGAVHWSVVPRRAVC